MTLSRYAEVYSIISIHDWRESIPVSAVQCSTVLNSKKPDINLMKTGIGQSKYGNLTLFHVV